MCEPETVEVHNVAVSIVPSDLQKKITKAWMNSGQAGLGDVNPIKKIGLLVSQQMDQLDIIHVNAVPDAAVGGEQGVEGGAKENVDFLGSHIFNLQQIVGDFSEQGELIILQPAASN